MRDEPPTIDHNPTETRPGNGIWWVVWPLIALLWLATWYFDGFIWDQLLLGLGTGGVLATWAIEITGNKTPDSWRRRDRH